LLKHQTRQHKHSRLAFGQLPFYDPGSSGDSTCAGLEDSTAGLGGYHGSIHPKRAKVFKEVKAADGSGIIPVQFQCSVAVHGPEGPINDPDPQAPLTALT
jgi:hypothetical protein